MAVEAKTRITDDDLLALGEDVRAEVIDGEIVIESTPQPVYHSLYAQRMATFINVFVSVHNLGRVFGAMTLYKLTVTDDKTITLARVPDVSYVSYERLPADASLDVILDIGPDIAVEVISETETHEAVIRKTNEYLDHGVRLVWHILPSLRQVHTYTAPNRSPAVLMESDSLTGGEVLPGFDVPVQAIFQTGETTLHVAALKKLMGL
jgi:Uma2 family endonuclease